MAVITIPSAVLELIARQSFGDMDFNLEFRGSATGSSQVRLFAPPRWTCALVGGNGLLPEQAAIWKSFLKSLRGRVNQLEVYDILNPIPAGTYRGSPVLTSGIAVGDTSIALADATQAGATWKRGDWVGTGSGSTRNLFMVMADVTANGSGAATLTVEPPARDAQTNGSAVVWNKPTCLMRRTTSQNNWDQDGPSTNGFSLDLMESWE